VLLIGDAEKALVDLRNLDRRVFEIRDNVLDGIDAAARNRFETVVVVMEGTLSRLAPILKALRRSTPARIVLLAQMHEEPIARRFVAQAPGEPKLADEYQVCPTCLASLRPCDASERVAKAKTESRVFDPQPPIQAPTDSERSVDVQQRMEQLERLATPGPPDPRARHAPGLRYRQFQALQRRLRTQHRRRNPSPGGHPDAPLLSALR